MLSLDSFKNNELCTIIDSDSQHMIVGGAIISRRKDVGQTVISNRKDIGSKVQSKALDIEDPDDNF